MEQVLPAQAPIAKKGIDMTTLKYIAIVAMTIDHLAWGFVNADSTLGVIMHFIGRTTGPIMFYAAVEGYHHTRDINRYTFRLFLFSLLSYFPFIYMFSETPYTFSDYFQLNVIFKIFFGVLAIRVRREVKNPLLKLFLLSLLLIVSVPGDWYYWGFFIILAFDFYYGDFKNQAFAYCLVILLSLGTVYILATPANSFFYYQDIDILAGLNPASITKLGYFVPIILLSFYKGEKGSSSPFFKWFFYLYYPLHLLIIGFLHKLV